jgi:transposase
MENQVKQKKKRSQRDYNLGFKLAVISQVEKGEMTYKQAQKAYGIQGKSTVLVWLRKFGNLDWKNPIIHSMSTPKSKETPAQKIKRLEKELEEQRLKNEMLNYMIDLSDKQYGTAIRKKFSPKQSEDSNKKKE